MVRLDQLITWLRGRIEGCRYPRAALICATAVIVSVISYVVWIILLMIPADTISQEVRSAPATFARNIGHRMKSVPAEFFASLRAILNGNLRSEYELRIEAAAAWQMHPVRVSKGQKVRIQSLTGQVHLAGNQLFNQAQFVRAVSRMKVDEAVRTLNADNYFYRTWSTPSGDGGAFPQDTLRDCLMFPEYKWGALMVGFISTAEAESELRAKDPYLLLIQRPELRPVPIAGFRQLEAPSDGYLVFIINEAVLSPLADRRPLVAEKYEKFLGALKLLNEHEGRDHVIEIGEIPLLCFYNNIGSFKIQLEVS